MRPVLTDAELDALLAEARSVDDKLKLLLDEERRLVAARPQSFLELADSLDQGALPNDDATRARFRCNRAAALFKLARYQEAEEDVRAALTIAERINLPSLMVDCLLRAGLLAMARGKPKDALAPLHRARDLNPESNRRAIHILENTASAHIMLGDYLLAMELLDEALAIAREAEVDLALSSIYSTIGILHSHQQQDAQARDYFQLALRASRAENNRRAEGKILINLLANCTAANVLDQTQLPLLAEARAIATEYSDLDSLGRIAVYFASVYTNIGQLDQAEQECEEALRIAERAGIVEIEFHALGQLSIIKERQGRLHEAIETALRSLALARRLGLRSDELRSLANLSYFNEMKGDIVVSLSYLKQHTELQRELNLEQMQHTVAQMQARINYESARHNTRLAEAETEVQKLRAEQLVVQMEKTRNDLIAKALQISQKNDLLRTMRRNVKDALDADPDAMRLRLRELLRNIDASLDDDHSWDHFNRQFQLLHPSFLKTLSVRYPSLSTTEQKVCALLKLKLSSKDICRILSIAARSIENYRYRIRKKLGLQGSENLTAFLAALD